MGDSTDIDDWTKLVMLALAVLDEAASDCRQGPVIGGVGLRAGLAALYWLSDRESREPFNVFWKVVTGKNDLPSDNTSIQNTCRGTAATIEMHRICRTLGFEYSVWLSGHLGNMRGARSVDRDARVPAAQAALAQIGRETFAESVKARREQDSEKRERHGMP